MERLKAAVAAVCALGSYIFGGMDTIMKILVIFIVIDRVSAVSSGSSYYAKAGDMSVK